jgi:hypothetical protein
MSQRRGLCARHFTANKNRQQLTGITVDSHHLSGYSAAKDFRTTSNDPIDSATLLDVFTIRHSVNRFSESFYWMSSICLKMSSIFHLEFPDNYESTTTPAHLIRPDKVFISLPEQSAYPQNDYADINQVGDSRSSITIMPSGKSFHKVFK